MNDLTLSSVYEILRWLFQFCANKDLIGYEYYVLRNMGESANLDSFLKRAVL